MGCGFSLAEIEESYRHALVVQAEKDLTESLGERPTKSRIALTTGLNRSAVAKYLAMKTPQAERPTSSLIVNKWTSESRWKDSEGRLLDLPFSGIRSFTELCESVSTKVRPRTILDEFLQTGLVAETREGIRLLNTSTHVTVNHHDRTLDTLHNLQMALNTYLMNLKHPGALYEQIHYSDGMPPNLGEWVALQIRESCRDFSKSVTGALQENEIEGESFDIHGVIVMQVHKPKGTQ